MNEENENKLVQDFPILYNGAEPYKNPADKIWKLLKNGPNPREVMHGGFSCGDGWFDILYELSAELYKLDEIPTVLQVKEKFGTLSYYVGFATDGVYDIIDKAAHESATTCDICGGPGELGSTGGGWITVRCEQHRDVR